ncbi:MAG: hypothetical protein IPN16_01910 [Gemmatimonadetes bacterium]|nr:hypothetical protein [Gemmatimonadota bacterium]
MPLPQIPLVPLVEVCFALGRSYSSLYGEVLRGVLPAERHGSRWFVRREVPERLQDARGVERKAVA